MISFVFVCIFHLAEHLAQLFQLFILHWNRPDCLGILGLLFPDLMRSQWLHWFYAVFMLSGLIVWKRFFGKTALILQGLHSVEHTLMLSFGFSIGELWFPRIELHFFYNLVVLVPMMWAFHRFSARRKFSASS